MGDAAIAQQPAAQREQPGPATPAPAGGIATPGPAVGGLPVSGLLLAGGAAAAGSGRRAAPSGPSDRAPDDPALGTPRPVPDLLRRSMTAGDGTTAAAAAGAPGRPRTRADDADPRLDPHRLALLRRSPAEAATTDAPTTDGPDAAHTSPPGTATPTGPEAADSATAPADEAGRPAAPTAPAGDGRWPVDPDHRVLSRAVAQFLARTAGAAAAADGQPDSRLARDRATVAAELARAIAQAKGATSAALDRYADSQKMDRESPVTAWVVRSLQGDSMTERQLYRISTVAQDKAIAADRALARGDLMDAADLTDQAVDAAGACARLARDYDQSTQSSAGLAVTYLEQVKFASQVILTVAGGYAAPLAGAIVTTGAGLVETGAVALERAMQGERVDWGEVAADAVVQVVMSVASFKLAPAIGKILPGLAARSPRLAEMLAERGAHRVAAAVVSGLVGTATGVLTAVVKDAAHLLIGKPVTTDELVAHVAAQFTLANISTALAGGGLGPIAALPAAQTTPPAGVETASPAPATADGAATVPAPAPTESAAPKPATTDTATTPPTPPAATPKSVTADAAPTTGPQTETPLGFHEFTLEQLDARAPSPSDTVLPQDAAGTGTSSHEFTPEQLGAVTQPRPRKRGFGEASTERGGTEARSGMHFHEYNPAEVAMGLRIDYDPVAGRPRTVKYTVRSDTVPQVSERGFATDRTVDAPQPVGADFRGTGMDQGHLAQREAAGGDKQVERALDLMTNVVPMTPSLNRGKGSLWRAAEQRATAWAEQHGSVDVAIDVIYSDKPPRMPSGVPVPQEFRRRVTGPDGTVLEDAVYPNR